MQIATLLQGKGRVMVCGALPMHIRSIEDKFARASIHSIHDLVMCVCVCVCHH